jgi:hypothetical protein
MCAFVEDCGGMKRHSREIAEAALSHVIGDEMKDLAAWRCTRKTPRKILDGAGGLGMMARTGRELAITHLRSARLSVCWETATRNSSKSYWQGSTIRQRTTP